MTKMRNKKHDKPQGKRPVVSAVKKDLFTPKYAGKVEKPAKGKGSFKRDKRVDF